jgi:hypothetical protein
VQTAITIRPVGALGLMNLPSAINYVPNAVAAGLIAPNDPAGGDNTSHEIWEGTSGYARDDGEFPALQGGYTRRFRVRTYTRYIGVDTIWGNLNDLFGIQMGNRYESSALTNEERYRIGRSSNAPLEWDDATTLSELQFERESQDGYSWIVTAQYTYFDPFNLPPRVTRDYQPMERILDIDWNGASVLNSAKDPFDPPILRDESRPIYTIRRYQYDFDETWPERYRDTINDDTCLGYPPLWVKCNKITAERKWSASLKIPKINNGYFYDVGFEVAINPDTWVKMVLDQGYRELDSSGNKTIITLSDGTAVTTPVPLDGNGKKILVKAGGPLVGVYLNFHAYREQHFAPLGLSLF